MRPVQPVRVNVQRVVMTPEEEHAFCVAVDQFLEAFVRDQTNQMRREGAPAPTDPTLPSDRPTAAKQAVEGRFTGHWSPVALWRRI